MQNILEDVISYNFSISDGTLTQAPILQATIIIDELTMAKKVYADLVQTQTSADIRCDGWGYEILEMTKSSATEWTLTHELSDEVSELCKYNLNFYINPFDETVETAPPTDGVHMSSGNKRLLSNSLQYSMFYEPYPQYEVGNLTAINNIRSDNTIDKTDDEQTLFFYIWNAQDANDYPSECTVNQYTLELDDGLGNIENLTTPYVATLDSSCASALTENTSTDPDKVRYEYYLYSIEPMKKLYSYIFSPNKASTIQVDDGKGGRSSRELLVTMGNISTINPRIALTWFELDKEFLPATANDDTTAFLYLEPADESGAWLNNSQLEIDLSDSLVGDESDIYPPEIDAINISSYTTDDYPQRNFVKFDVDITNDAPSGALTSVRDMWISYRGGPRCDSNIVSYVRDDLDGKIDTSINRLTATVPFLKNDEGTYEIILANINDHGYAEYIYYDQDIGSGSNMNASFIGQTFTVGDGSNTTCPYFTNYYDYASVDVNEGETLIGEFAALGSSDDTITYSLSDYLVGNEEGTGISDLVQISSDGVLSYINPLDYETDSHGRASDKTGGVTITATSSLDPSLSRDLIVQVTLINLNDETPVITSSANFSVNEGETEVGCIAVTDADGGTMSAPDGINCGNPAGLTYSISGDNLEIDSYGRISFTSAPDYETKSSYTGTVSVSDGVNSTTQDITISIVDVNDNSPIVTSNTTFTVSENQTGVGQITVSDADTNSSFTFAIVSDYEDGNLFNIDSDGVITFKANANHETAGQYTIKVNISDGTNSVAQIFTINLTDICEFDFENISYVNQMAEDQFAQTAPLENDTLNSAFFYQFDIDTTDDACTVPADETYTFSLSGDDADKFSLASETGNDSDNNYIYLNSVFDHESPTDKNSDNIYEVTLNTTLGDFTETRDLSLTINDAYEFGEIQSYTFDEASSIFTINFLVNDVPSNTSKLKFSIRGPSFPSTSTFLEKTIDYDPGTSSYAVELDAGADLLTNFPEDTKIYGGYYSVYRIEALDADENLVLGDSNDDIQNSNIKGNRHLYYERSDGSNYAKLNSISGALNYDATTNSVLFSATANLSNINYGSISTSSNLRFETSNDIERMNGNGTTLSFDSNSIEVTGDGSADFTHSLYFSPNLRSGNHKYRIRIRDYAPRGLFYTYIYWSELVEMGLVTDPMNYTNSVGTSDLEGPRASSYTQPSIGSCTYYPNEEPSRVRLRNVTSSLVATDDSLSSNSGYSDTDTYARLSFGNFTSDGDLISNAQLIGGSATIDGNTGTFQMNDSYADYDINDTSDETQFILQPRYLDIYDAAGNVTSFEDGNSYWEVRYPLVSEIYNDIDLRDHCNFNLGDNAPIFTSDSSFTIAENETSVGTVTATDADNDTVEYTINLSGADSRLFGVDLSSGALIFLTAPDYENPSDEDTDNVYSLIVDATDGFNTTQQSIDVTVTNISDSAPTFTSSGSFTVAENETAIGTVAATDVDGDTVSFSLSGTDEDSLQIDSSSGLLTFKTAPDYETKSLYNATVAASDGTYTSAQTISITITNVNEFTPTFSSASSFTVAENQTDGPTVEATDGDGETITYSITGGADASSLEINSSTGVLTFKTAPDYETKSTYQLTVRASDGTNNGAQDITISIGNLNEHAPSLTPSGASTNEGSTAVTTIIATDADGDETITFSISDTGLGCTDNSFFSIGESTGVLTFKSAPDYENPADSDTDNQYKVCVLASDNGGAAGTYSVETVNTQDMLVNVTVVDIDDTSPVFTSSATFSADENQTSIGTVTASDQDGDTLTFSIIDGDTELSINSSSGVLVFNIIPDYETKPRYPPVGANGEAYTVRVSDGTNSTNQSLVINIVNLNDNSPVITSSATFSADENQTTIGTVTASDADGDTLIFSSSDTNIPINSSSGVLSFATAPDFEVQNTYTVTITASDGIPGRAGTNSTTQEITITINDLDD